MDKSQVHSRRRGSNGQLLPSERPSAISRTSATITAPTADTGARARDVVPPALPWNFVTHVEQFNESFQSILDHSGTIQAPGSADAAPAAVFPIPLEFPLRFLRVDMMEASPATPCMLTAGIGGYLALDDSLSRTSVTYDLTPAVPDGLRRIIAPFWGSFSTISSVTPRSKRGIFYRYDIVGGRRCLTIEWRVSAGALLPAGGFQLRLWERINDQALLEFLYDRSAAITLPIPTVLGDHSGAFVGLKFDGQAEPMPCADQQCAFLMIEPTPAELPEPTLVRTLPCGAGAAGPIPLLFSDSPIEFGLPASRSFHYDFPPVHYRIKPVESETGWDKTITAAGGR